MPDVEICCLANSRKHGGRCIAGIELSTGRWVRPVSGNEDGHFEYYQILIPPTGREPQILDYLRFPEARKMPEKHQPENTLFARGGRWTLVDRPQTTEQFRQRYHLLKQYLADEPLLFGSEGDRVPFTQFDTAPSPYSLLLIRPQSVRWQIRATTKGNRQLRTQFRYNAHDYDFGVTDPLWETRLQALKPGIYPRDIAGLTPKHVLWFCLSLGEPFSEDGLCFKLVATVMVWPPL